MPRCPCPDSTRGAETPRRASSAHDAPSRGAGCVSSGRPLPRLAGIGHSPSEIQPLLPSLPVLPGTAAAARGWLAWSQHDLAKRYWPKWATRDFERGHWSQIDREPRAPPKFQGSPWSLSLPLLGPCLQRASIIETTTYSRFPETNILLPHPDGPANGFANRLSATVTQCQTETKTFGERPRGALRRPRTQRTRTPGPS
jgi:hypothetical protein